MTSLIVDCHWIFFLRNPDVIIALDGNFQHRRFAHVKDDPRILLEEDHYNWITDTEIAEAKEYIQVHRSRPDMDHHQKASSQVPRHILDECKKSYQASQERDQDPDISIYDSKGVMAIVCRHDIPLFIADIKTLGEPRYYAIALLRKIASELPPTATIGVMYDIADQLHQSIAKVMVMIPDKYIPILTSNP